MSRLKALSRLLLVLAGLSAPLGALAQLNRSHPFLPPPTDYYVSLYQETEFDALTMQQRGPGLPSDRVVEGRKLSVGYLRERGAASGSRLLIVRHYEKAIQAAGGEILYTTGTRTEPLYLGFRLQHNGADIIGEVDATAGGNDFMVTTVAAPSAAPPAAAQSRPTESTAAAAPPASGADAPSETARFEAEPLTRCGELSGNHRFVAVSFQHAIVVRSRPTVTETSVCRWASGDNSTELTHAQYPGVATGFGAYGAWGEPEGLLLNATIADPVRGRADTALRLHRPLERRVEGRATPLTVPPQMDTPDVNWEPDLPLAGGGSFGGTWQKTASIPLTYTTSLPLPLTVRQTETRKVPTAPASRQVEGTGEDPNQFVYQTTVWTMPYVDIEGAVHGLPMPARARHAAILDAGVGDYSGDAQLPGGQPNGDAAEPSQLAYVAVGCTSGTELDPSYANGYPTVWWSFDGRQWHVASHAAQTGCIKAIGQIGNRIATARLGGESWRTEGWRFEEECRTVFDHSIPLLVRTKQVCDGSGSWVDGKERRVVSGQLATVRAAGWLGGQPKPAYFEVDLAQGLMYAHVVDEEAGRGTLVYPCLVGWCLMATMESTRRAHRFGFSQTWVRPPPLSDQPGHYEFRTITREDLTSMVRQSGQNVKITECLRETYVEGKQIFACNGMVGATETPLVLRYVE